MPLEPSFPEIPLTTSPPALPVIKNSSKKTITPVELGLDPNFRGPGDYRPVYGIVDDADPKLPMTKAELRDVAHSTI